jgi:TatD DNase family protein
MLDAHCHIDLYPNPTQIAMDAERAGVFTVLVTNLPSAFEAAYPNVRPFKKIRLALGLHPLNATLHSDNERELFKVLVDKTSFIGEVGLDFSSAGYKTRDRQITSFQYALQIRHRALPESRDGCTGNGESGIRHADRPALVYGCEQSP